MTQTNQNFEIYAGDSKNIIVTMSDVDLTGATIKWALKKKVYSSEVSITKSTDSGISLTDPENGVFTISLLPGDTVSLSGVYYHEAEITDAQGNVSTVLSGTVKINLSGV